MKRNKKHENRVRKMVVACSLSAIVLTASTYAWFIGMKTVNVAPFQVNIAAIDGLALSLNGEDFSETVNIDSSNYNESSVVGTGNQNVWGKLIPMSSIGDINQEKSKLTLFEKGSLTPTDGGYRLLASEVNNTADAETRGYVAFDLFVKNLSGNAYYKEVNKLNEEAIYLTTESTVKVKDAGAKADKTGIENSVRLAFAQIGRVEAGGANTTGENVRKITCAGGKVGAPETQADSLGICENRRATIWEPNDTKHVVNAINWYNTSCKLRSGESTYGEKCKTIEDGTAYPTYAITKPITVQSPNKIVDVYDGEAYNGYTKTLITSNDEKSQFLKELKSANDYLPGAVPTDLNYFTDTDKLETGVNRQPFITLAPKSITKIRVYIYLEGQDVDNYDFASLGKKIEVSFGFTKERFTGQDINYQGEPVLPDDVQSELKYMHDASSGTIGDITNGVKYSGDHFVIPRGVKEFTFVQNGGSAEGTYKATVLKTTYVDPDNHLSPSTITWQVSKTN